jgi:hypothetical protein
MRERGSLMQIVAQLDFQGFEGSAAHENPRSNVILETWSGRMAAGCPSGRWTSITAMVPLSKCLYI